MHQARWTLKYINNDFAFGRTVYCTYISDTEYNSSMLAEDLIEAGILVENVSFEEDTDSPTEQHSGQCTAAEFIDHYDRIRFLGNSGTNYRFSCILNDIPFCCETGDDEAGKPYSRIVISSESLCFDAAHLIRLLKK